MSGNRRLPTTFLGTPTGPFPPLALFLLLSSFLLAFLAMMCSFGLRLRKARGTETPGVLLTASQDHPRTVAWRRFGMTKAGDCGIKRECREWEEGAPGNGVIAVVFHKSRYGLSNFAIDPNAPCLVRLPLPCRTAGGGDDFYPVLGYRPCSPKHNVTIRKMQTLFACFLHGRCRRTSTHPHFESPQLRQVMQPSIFTTAFIEHLPHSCAVAGNADASPPSQSLCVTARDSASRRFCSMNCF